MAGSSLAVFTEHVGALRCALGGDEAAAADLAQKLRLDARVLHGVDGAVQQHDDLRAERAVLCGGLLLQALVERLGDIAHVQDGHGSPHSMPWLHSATTSRLLGGRIRRRSEAEDLSPRRGCRSWAGSPAASGCAGPRSNPAPVASPPPP